MFTTYLGGAVGRLVPAGGVSPHLGRRELRQRARYPTRHLGGRCVWGVLGDAQRMHLCMFWSETKKGEWRGPTYLFSGHAKPVG